MSKFSGFAPLKDQEDLLKKMKHDLGRMKSDPTDSYAAFDFFVTSEHMLDWGFPNDRAKMKSMRKQHKILQIVSHIANGAKHFEATSRHHQSVDDLSFSQGGFDSNSFCTKSFDPSSFKFSGLTINLSDGESIHASDLAEEVYAFWTRNLSGEAQHNR